MADETEIEKRRDDAGSIALGKATSLAAKVAPERVVGKKVRQIDADEVQKQLDQAKELADKHPELEKQMSIWACFGQNEPEQTQSISNPTIDDLPLVYNNTSGRFFPVTKTIGDKTITIPAGYHPLLTANTQKNKYIQELDQRFIGEGEWKLYLVLRHMAIYQGGIFLDGRYGLKFTLRELRRNYKQFTGKTLNGLDAAHRLMTLRTAIYQVKDDNKSMHFSLLKELYLVNMDEYQKNPNTECYVEFDNSTEATIKNGAGRLIDHELTCKLPYLAGWLYMKLEREFTFARKNNMIENYHGKPEPKFSLHMLNTLNKAGVPRENIRDAKNDFIEALNQLIGVGVIDHYLFEDKKAPSGESGGRKALIDVEVHIYPTLEWSLNMAEKNRVHKLLGDGKTSEKLSLKTLIQKTPPKGTSEAEKFGKFMKISAKKPEADGPAAT